MYAGLFSNKNQHKDIISKEILKYIYKNNAKNVLDDLEHHLS